jgi:hypothetical protein
VQGVDAQLVNYGTIVTHGDYDGISDFSSEGMFAEGDRFYIANYGNIRIEGLFSSGLFGLGHDGVLINSGRIDSTAEGSAVLDAAGDGSQAINTGQVTASGEDIAAMLVGGKGPQPIAARSLSSATLPGGWPPWQAKTITSPIRVPSTLPATTALECWT